ncbi:EXS family protein isoform 1 [Dorcoceras hygrometricum]|uniref:EXS family protein isoform 1 n=1 Tax=Dorcoceras hygrometricum TaxID=472368 RepID=A0A2Z7A398_9LAMI|nr:EXS family protein isoform 1 [Dorcoceras hygrometricum]
MKFGKELTSQMVPEWQGAYMDYNNLKKLLKDILRFRQQNMVSGSGPTARRGALKRRSTLYRAFSGLTNRYNNVRAGSPHESDDEVILVGSVQQEGSENYYQTTFLRSSDAGGEYEFMYFRALDREFNKVLKFYEEKVQEVKVVAEELSKQMEALIALRIKVENPGSEQRSPSETSSTCPWPPTSKPVAPMDPPKFSPGPKGITCVELFDMNCARFLVLFNLSMPLYMSQSPRMEVIHEVEMTSEGTSRDEQITTENRKLNAGQFKPASLNVLGHVTLNVDPETPVSTLKNVLMSSKSDLSFSTEELRRVEEKLRQAFAEFYQQLRFLKSYCFLNTLAFSKIMKKYDKITSRNASRSYLDMVDKSYLGSSEEVNKLIERLEVSFIKHFANGNRRNGMKSLRPKHKKERHQTTFFLGLFTGCSIALVIGIMVSIHLRKLLDNPGREQYMEAIFPLYSLFGYIFLHILMYGANTYYWKRYSVNYPFILGFKPGTELGFREIFLVATGLSVLALAAALSNLDMEMDRRTAKFQTVTELVPLGLVALVLLITFCPFNIIYRSSRFFLIRCAWHCILAPLYKVTMPDFFLADQLTSQVQALRCIQFYICYYTLGDFTKRSVTFVTGHTYKIFIIVVAIIPFLWRVLQCLRRFFEEKDSSQGVNSLKYFSTVVALVLRTVYEQRRRERDESFWRILATSSSGVTTIFNTYWDIVIDWGLLRRNSNNPWLRDKLLVSNKAVYFVAIVVNILLRLVWMQLVLDIEDGPFLHKKAMIALVAALEILRRGIWNFFRMENEHLNNVGKYRAFKHVPLPFHYADEKIM